LRWRITGVLPESKRRRTATRSSCPERLEEGLCVAVRRSLSLAGRIWQRRMVERAVFEPAYACAGRFTVWSITPPDRPKTYSP